VIAADTVVALGREIMGQPASKVEALEMLKKLAGQTHIVYTGCCIRVPNGHHESFCVTSEVTMHPWPEPVLRAYVDGGESEDKAGAYSIQGQGAFLVERITGSWTSVVGLPLTELLAILFRNGIISSPREA
jgi:septum formation protein